MVDTGSVDRTVEIAKSFDAIVLERQWRHDFAWARNEGLNAASGDWILYIDADERLVVPDGVDIREGLDRPEVVSALVQFHPTVHGSPYLEYRLFRNDPRIRFRGSMHETMLPDIERLQRESGAKVITSEVEMVHLGYEQGSEWKHERNLPLLRAAIEQTPDRLYYWYHLAVTLAGLGRNDEAIDVGAEGMRRARDVIVGDQRNSAIAALVAMTHARLLHLRGDDALPTILEGYGFYPRNPSLQLLEAQIRLDRDEAETALVILSELAAQDGRTYRDGRISHDRRIFDVYAPDLMGVALLRLGRRDEAAAAFARAARAAPDDMSYRIKAQAMGARL